MCFASVTFLMQENFWVLPDLRDLETSAQDLLEWVFFRQV